MAGSHEVLSPAQHALADLWEAHMAAEFQARSADQAVETMTEDAHLIHVPVMTGASGREALRAFYDTVFIPQQAPDTELEPISRTIGANSLADEFLFKFTHTVRMEWMLPGIAPTGRRVEVPTVAIIQFRDGKIASEHIYWDQASVLSQLGRLDETSLPVVGVATARKVRDASLVGKPWSRR